ncbi:MAG: type I methionyl aminopeptidase [Chitinivibrionales bacterium]|nr:type I methionyl aminopeptidase [Chitinivibrionales bacterium]MBD3357646.1 type I methionyl aminopeptidase [Chitinivibrionales bacterium]
MIGRNDPCWCGSGKKYKKCHMHEDAGRAAKKNGREARMVKSPEELEGMRRAGEFNGRLMDYVREQVKPGVSTAHLDRLAYDYTLDHGHKPACLGYHGFPKSVCTSINDVVCHGIPSTKEVLKDGDIVNVDLTTIVEGFHADSSETFMIGEVSDKARHLVEVTAIALLRGIDAVGPNVPLIEVSKAIEPYVKSQGCSVVRQYTGHGVGRKFHEFFTVYHHVDPDADDIVLRPGMTLTIEPMINLGSWKVVTDRVDGWTVRTRDGSLSAQFEHTIAVTETGAEILTLTPSQRRTGGILNVDGIALNIAGNTISRREN